MAYRLIKGTNDFRTWCLQHDRLDLLSEWDAEKNLPLTPDEVAYGSAKKVWWIGGKCGHSYQAALNKRTSDGTGCPYCTGSHAKLLVGFNDLATTNPEIVADWDYEKNGPLLPTMVMKGQHIKVWWKGACGHSWESTVYHRVGGRGCPICADEAKTSFPEQVLYFYAKQVFPDAENGNMEALGNKELDIFIPSLNVALEYDGERWHKDLKKDLTKNRLCREKGIKLIRVREIGCPRMKDEDGVSVIPCVSADESSLMDSVLKAFEIIGRCPDIDFDRDRQRIYAEYLIRKREDSLASRYPSIAEEWDYERNEGLAPENVSAKSAKKVWWVGKCGHHWQAAIASRTNMNSGCPYCAGKLLKGFNDLETLRPDVLKNWNYSKNKGLKPSDFTVNSKTKIWWHCSTCGNDHFAPISYKVKFPDSCPYCSHKTADEGVTDLAAINPQLASEWDREKNGELKPNQVLPRSDKKVWWICPKGHSYQATVSNRTNGRGCPICSGRVTVVGVNDFATMHPELLAEWDYEKNEKDPSEYAEHQRVLVWWKDSQGRSWRQTIEARSYGHGFNERAKRKVMNLDTGVIYSSLAEAGKSCGLKSGDAIAYCCKGKLKTAGGYRWKFLN